MAEREQNIGNGTGFFGFLALIFITLKLTGYIDWSWWLVLSPIWGLFVAVFGFLLIYVIVVVGREWWRDRKTMRAYRARQAMKKAEVVDGEPLI